MNVVKKRLLARINGIQTSLAKYHSNFLIQLEKQLLKDLNDIFKKERLIWAQKAGMNWRRYADFNTRYFHLLAKIKKSRGKILALKDSDGNWVSDNQELKIMATSYFRQMFQTRHVSSSWAVNLSSKNTIKDQDCIALLKPITDEEVKYNLFQMDPIKSPGPDGIQPVFYQTFWNDIGPSIVKFCKTCFESATISEEINSSYITLIPKSDQPESMAEFRPIGLCNTIYKLITKIITNRIRPILGGIISPLQSSFIKGRGIEDNIIVVKEVAHHFHKAKKGKNIMALKLDLTKAYDSLEWSFIRDTLLSYKFPGKLIDLIMCCITTPKIAVL